MGEEIKFDPDSFRRQVIRDTWDKGLPMVYMEKNGDIVKHYKCGFKVKIGNAYSKEDKGSA